jgi:hypothetical protein
MIYELIRHISPNLKYVSTYCHQRWAQFSYIIEIVLLLNISDDELNMDCECLRLSMQYFSQIKAVSFIGGQRSLNKVSFNSPYYRQEA